jgi:hypothetical protein
MGCIRRENIHLLAYHVTTQPNLQDDLKQWRILILFTDEKYFELDDILKRQNNRVYALSRQEADEYGGIRFVSKFSKDYGMARYI